MLHKIINVSGTNWFVREAMDEEAALNCIAMAKVTGSVGGKDYVNEKIYADVVRLRDDGHECLPYGGKGIDRSYLLEDGVQADKTPV